MIQIEEKQKCCGCSACEQICPKHCIQMASDRQGFLYPIVDQDNCIDCHLCEKVCPVLHQNKERKPIEAYAAFNKDEQIRLESSSGGIFTLLAEKTLQQGGVVFGAMFNEKWEVVHSYIESPKDLAKLRGSKYVQSKINNCFTVAQKFLNQGRQVLFSGTPCQIAAFRLFLMKDYVNLLLVDVACHGVPSPLLWKDYLMLFKTERIISISFRDKRNGWSNYSYVINNDDREILSQIHRDNIYSQGFLNDLTIRPSCFACPAKSGKSCSDLTIADFWGIDNVLPNRNDEKGVNLILANTPLGHHLIEQLRNAQVEKVEFSQAVQHNPAITRSVRKPKSYDWFWAHYPKIGFESINKANIRTKPNLFQKIAALMQHKLS